MESQEDKLRRLRDQRVLYRHWRWGAIHEGIVGELSPDGKYVKIGALSWHDVREITIISELESGMLPQIVCKVS